MIPTALLEKTTLQERCELLISDFLLFHTLFLIQVCVKQVAVVKHPLVLREQIFFPATKQLFLLFFSPDFRSCALWFTGDSGEVTFQQQEILSDVLALAQAVSSSAHGRGGNALAVKVWSVQWMSSSLAKAETCVSSQHLSCVATGGVLHPKRVWDVATP